MQKLSSFLSVDISAWHTTLYGTSSMYDFLYMQNYFFLLLIMLVKYITMP